MLHLDHQFLRAAGETSRKWRPESLGSCWRSSCSPPASESSPCSGCLKVFLSSERLQPKSSLYQTWVCWHGAYWFFYPVGNTSSQLPWLLLWLMQCFMWLRFLFFWHILLKKYPQIFWHLMVLWRLFEIQMECWRVGFIIVYLILW